VKRIMRGAGVLAAFSALLLAGCGDGGADTDAMESDMGDMPAAMEPGAEPMEPATSGPAFVDPNQASRDELAGVEGMSAAAADALIAGRPYSDMLAVDRVLAAHVDSAGRETVYSRIWIPIDLNAASEEEILLIPGVGPRIAGEFEEYRPYQNIEQFRREMGKYVDENEVARLERYVSIR